MRALLLSVLVIALGAGETTPGERLRAIGEDWQAVNHALIQLRQGRVEALAALPPRLFTEPLAAADPGATDAPARHWTSYLPRVLAELDAGQRASALATLEACYHGRLAQGDQPAAALATRFLPAPAAVAALERERDRAFDRGAFTRTLALDDLLADAGAGDADDQRRSDVARRLSGRAADADASLALAAPGLPIPTAAHVRPEDAGLTIGWSVAPGALAGLDPWGRPLWTRPIERDARVVTGPGGAIVVGSHGVRLVDEDGRVAEQAAPPPGTRALAVAGGAAWFARGATIHRVPLGGGTTSTLLLPDEPVCPPLVRAGDSLWLTADELLLVREGAVAERIFHGLAPQPHWRLGFDRSQLLIDTGAAQTWRLEALSDQMRRAGVGQRIALARAIGDWRAVIAMVEAEPAALQVEANLDAALLAYATAARDAEDAATRDAAIAAGLALAPAASRALVLQHSGSREELRAALIDSAPGLELPGPGHQPIAPRASWDHVLGATGLLRALDGMPADPPAVRSDRPVGSAVESVAEVASRRDPVGIVIALSHEPGETTATVREADGALRWRHRWRAPPYDAAPGRSWACIDGHLLVGEGASRLTALALADGTRLGQIDLIACDARPAQATVVGAAPLTIAILHPLGVERSLTIATSDGERTIALPARPRWTVPIPGGRLLVAFADRALTVAGDGVTAPCELPGDLLAGAEPTPTDAGLARDGRLWAWNARESR